MEATDRGVSTEQVSQLAQVNKLRPKESDFIGKPGYERKYAKDGTYKWRYKFRPNDNGKLTREGAEVQERLRPFQEADTNRVLGLPKKPAVAMRDRDGKINYIDPTLADKQARKAGWTHVWRAGGASVERGVDGMLFRRWRNGWEPLGVRCLGKPLVDAPLESPQRDPSMGIWVQNNGEWVKA